MPDQFCPNCGTEVDADARFCPTCGQTLGEQAVSEEAAGGDVAGGGFASDDEEAGLTSPIPTAPAWPPVEPGPEAEAEPAAGEEAAATSAQPAVPAESHPEPDLPPEPEPGDESDDDIAGPPPIPAWRQQAPSAPSSGSEPPLTPPVAGSPPGAAPAGGPDDLPITLPTMLSGWLIGGGSGFAALALLPSLANVLNVLIFVALLWVTATVFLADRVPRFEHQRLAVLVTVILSLGVGLDRAAFTVRGVETIFLVMALVAAAGVMLVELDIDRPLPPSGGTS